MFRQLNFRSFFHFLGRNKLYTAINIFGLSLSLMFVVLIADYTVRQLSTDNFQQKADRIYVLAGDRYIGTAYKIADRLLPRYPEIEKICSATPYGKHTVEIAGNKLQARMFFVDTTFFDVFSFHLTAGDARQALMSKDNVVVSESFARQVFGTFSPIGQVIRFVVEDQTRERVVSGVMEDINNSIFPECDIMMRFDNLADYNSWMLDDDLGNAGSDALFILEKQGADIRSKEEDMATYFKEFFWPYKGGNMHDVDLIPLRDIYFSQAESYVDLRRGEWSFVLILITVGLVILAFAVMNYVNLTVAQTGFRAREMATRRLLGASRGEVILKLVLESTLLCALAFVIALCLAVAVEPWAAQLLGDKIDVWGDLNGLFGGSYGLLVIVLGIISGIVPAWIVSGFKPIDVVRGTFRRRTKMLYSKLLIALQNVITISLIACTLTILLQIRHLINHPLGYSTENILDVDLWEQFHNEPEIYAFRDALQELPCVEMVGLSCGTPLDRGNNNTISYGPDRMISFQSFVFDTVCVRMLGLRIKQDNKAEQEAFFLNEEAFRQLEIPEDSPSVKLGADKNWEWKIGGVYHDFHIGSIIDDQSAAYIQHVNDFADPNRKDKQSPWNILIKIRGDQAEAYQAVRDVAQRINGGMPFEAKYLGQQIEEEYAAQWRTSRIVMIFTFVAMLISALGLLAMSTYFIQQKQQEVAVRKVFGSTRREILGRLVGHFMKLVGVAFILAVPVVWYVMNWWLSGYSIRISLSPFIFLAAGFFALVVAFVTVYWQSRRAANANPIGSIKN